MLNLRDANKVIIIITKAFHTNSRILVRARLECVLLLEREYSKIACEYSRSS